MLYECKICDYKTNSQSNFCNHKKTKKHLENIENLDTTSLENIIAVPKISKSSKISKNSENGTKKTAIILECENCSKKYITKSGLFKHKKSCCPKTDPNNSSQEIIISELKHKLEITEKEKEFEKKEKELYKKLEEQKSEFLNNFMNNANVLLNKANDNTKITAQAMQSVTISAIKYANEKFKTAPILLPINNFDINNLSFDKKEDRIQLTETLIYNAKLKSLDKLLGNHIIKYYKKDNPLKQSIYTTDCSRLNYIVRELIENVEKWEIDKNGIKICTKIIKPLIDKCIELLLEYQKELIDELAEGNYRNKENVHIIINIIMSIDKGSLESDINKYIAPHFNITK
jgi:hypothetical protein